MFRRLLDCLPKEMEFPDDLAALGFVVNEKSQLRAIEDQEQVYKFPVTTNIRLNECYREAIYKSVQSEIIHRVMRIGSLQPLYLPQLTTNPPDGHTPHLPILISTNLNEAERVIFVVQDPYVHWLCWSWKDIEGDNGIENGSIVGLTKAVKEDPKLGLVMLNPCQLLYSYELGTAMSEESWERRGRNSMVHPPKTVLDINHIPGNKTAAEHISFVFEKLLNGASWINPKAKIDIIGINEGCGLILQFLSDNWDVYGERVSAVALANCSMVPMTVQWKPFIEFMAKQGRAWQASDEPENTVVSTPHDSDLVESFEDLDVKETEEPEDPEWPGRKEAAENQKLMDRVLCPIVSCGSCEVPVEAFGKSYKRILEWLAEDPSGRRWKNIKCRKADCHGIQSYPKNGAENSE